MLPAGEEPAAQKPVNVGDQVRIDGLVSRPELNGKFGKATRYISEKGRFAVAVDGALWALESAEIPARAPSL